MKENEKIQKIFILATIVVAILFIPLIAFVINKNNNSNITNISQKSENPTSESTGTQIGKTVDESEKDLLAEIDDIEIKTAEVEITPTPAVKKKTTETASNTDESQEEKAKQSEESEKTEELKETSNTEITFEAPVIGPIVREFAKDSLVYSDTLKEWITHNGVDIKADKTSVVTSAAEGTIYAIKNDPRYGLTVIINHSDGYQTIYSNLLTAEFVVEGEKVEKGQSIGTVGNTASFEILDEPHLHFELLKGDEYLDPRIYIEFE